MRPARHLVVLDHHDSFTYNIVQLLSTLGALCEVLTPECVDAARLVAAPPDGIVLSPGPGHPRGALTTLAVLERIAVQVPVLGVCLGHQAIGLHFGARVVPARSVMHGKVTRVHHDGSTLFHDVPSPLSMARYNSLSLEPSSLPECLRVTGWDDEGEVLAVRHRALPIDGLQFHPESILSQGGDRLLSNWLASL